MSFQTSIHKAMQTGTGGGDVLRMYENKMLELEINSGKGFARIVTTPTTQNPCPVFINEKTRARITNPSLDFSNIDKNFIGGIIHAEFKMDDPTVTDYTGKNPIKLSQNFLLFHSPPASVLKTYYRIFVGFKAAIQAVDKYQIYCETQDTGVFNAESVYQR